MELAHREQLKFLCGLTNLTIPGKVLLEIEREKNRKLPVYENGFEALKQVANDYLLVGGILCQLAHPVKTFFFTNWLLELPWVLPKWFATTVLGKACSGEADGEIPGISANQTRLIGKCVRNPELGLSFRIYADYSGQAKLDYRS